MTLSLFRPTTVGHDYPGATWQDLTSQAAPCQVCAAAEPAGNDFKGLKTFALEWFNLALPGWFVPSSLDSRTPGWLFSLHQQVLVH